MTVERLPAAERRGADTNVIDDGDLKVAEIISHVVSLSDWRRGFEMLRRREGTKILIDPSP